MAIVKFVASGCPMNNIFGYISREEATERKLTDGIMCTPESALEEFRFVKAKFGKEDGRQYYHIVQSFSPDDKLTPETAHEIGMKFAEYFKGYQAVVATHINTGHIHNHIILNSVNYENGYKFHQTRDEMLRAKRYSNELCKQHGLSVTEEKCEYGKMPQWKQYLKAFIKYSLERSPDKVSFVENMRRHGYDVRWEDGHKYVTFTTPEGYRCRDNKLFDDRYLRCNMEIYFAMGGCTSPAAREYLEFDMPEHKPSAHMTIGNELVFVMANIFRGSEKKKTKEEIEREERAKNAEAAMGLFIAAVLLVAEKYREDYTNNPEKYGLKRYGQYNGPQLKM